METLTKKNKVIRKREKDFLSLLGYNYIKSRKFENAAVIYKAMHHLFPDNRNYKLYLSYLYLHIKEYKKAVYFADRYLENETENKQGSLIKGKALFELGSIEEAKICAGKVLIK